MVLLEFDSSAGLRPERVVFMDKEEIWENELEGMKKRLNHEVKLLNESIDGRGEDITTDYSDKISRAQLEQIADIVESMSEHIGDGEAISITTQLQLENND